MVIYYIQKTLTTNGNAFGFSGTNIQLSLDSEVTKVEENIEKKYAANIQRPRSRLNWPNYASSSIIVDLKQIKWTIIVTGILTNDSGNLTGVSPSTAATAVNKKNLLIAMAEHGGSVTFKHRNNSNAETVQIISMQFTDESTEVGSDETTIMKEGEMRLGFTITMQKGADR